MTVGEPLHRRVHVDEPEQPGSHLVEVTDHAADVRHGRVQLGLQPPGHLVVDAVDLDLRPRFDGQRVTAAARRVRSLNARHAAQLVLRITFDDEHRMHEEMDVETVTLQQHAHRVDEERHVVRDHQHDRMGCRPTVALTVRRHHPDDGRACWTASPEVEVGGADRVDVVDLAVVDVLLGQLGVVQGEELSEQFVVRSADGGKLAKADRASRPRRYAPAWSTSCPDDAVGAFVTSGTVVGVAGSALSGARVTAGATSVVGVGGARLIKGSPVVVVSVDGGTDGNGAIGAVVAESGAAGLVVGGAGGASSARPNTATYVK